MNHDETAATQALDDYYNAFSTLRIEAILPYFHQPALLIFPQAVIAAPTSDELATVFGPAIHDLRARGYGRSEFVRQQISRLSATAVSAKGVAVRYKLDGAELERVSITYLLHKAEAKWRIAVMVLHDAQ